MAQYCDTKDIEKNWFHWLLSTSTPGLEEYRKLGLLWTKLVDNDNTNEPKSPLHKNRHHCLALSIPIYFKSNDDDIQKGEAFIDGESQTVELPNPKDINLHSDAWFHLFDTPFMQIDKTIPNLKKNGFVLELPTNITWHNMLTNINLMCIGIATKFKQPNDEEHHDLANEALLQVTRKLVAHKLVYIPGKAPVFNLLTTTIYRIMYSIMNRRKTQRNGFQKYAATIATTSRH